MTLSRRALAAVLAAALLGAGPALADTSVTLSSAWQKIASAGATVDVQNVSGAPALLLTSATQPVAGLQGQVVAPGDHRFYTLTADLYAVGSPSGVVVITTGISGPAAASGGGSFAGNITQLAGTSIATGAGASSAGTLQVIQATNSRISADIGNSNDIAKDASLQTANGYLYTLAGAAQAYPDSFALSGLTAATDSAAGVVGPAYFDTTGYQSVQLTLTGSLSGTILYQDSSTTNSADFVAGYGVNTGTNAGLNYLNGAGNYCFPAKGRYGRFNVQSYSSGTGSFTAVLRSTPCAPTALKVDQGPNSFPWGTAEAGSGASTYGIVPLATPPAGATAYTPPSVHNLYHARITNLSATAQFVAVINAAAAPSGGTAITPLICDPLPASGPDVINLIPGPGAYFGSGITVLITTTCATYTAGAASMITVLAR